MSGKRVHGAVEVGGRLLDVAMAFCLLTIFFLGPTLAERGFARIDGHTSFVAENRG